MRSCPLLIWALLLLCIAGLPSEGGAATGFYSTRFDEPGCGGPDSPTIQGNADCDHAASPCPLGSGECAFFGALSAQQASAELNDPRAWPNRTSGTLYFDTLFSFTRARDDGYQVLFFWKGNDDATVADLSFDGNDRNSVGDISPSQFRANCDDSGGFKGAGSGNGIAVLRTYKFRVVLDLDAGTEELCLSRATSGWDACDVAHSTCGGMDIVAQHGGVTGYKVHARFRELAVDDATDWDHVLDDLAVCDANPGHDRCQLVRHDFSVTEPIPFHGSGIAGTIRPVSRAEGSGPPDCLGGATCAPEDEDALYYSVRLAPDSEPLLALGPFVARASEPAVSAGFVPDDDVGSRSPTDAVFFTSLEGEVSAGVRFDDVGERHLDGGETSDALFTSFPRDEIETAIAEGRAVAFEIFPADRARPAFETDAGTPELVPEPGRGLVELAFVASLGRLARHRARCSRRRAKRAPDAAAPLPSHATRSRAGYLGLRASRPPVGAGRARWL